MNNKDWRPHAKHIIKAIEQTIEFQNRGNIANDDLVYAGTLRNLHTISESTKYIPNEIKSKYPDVLWLEIIGFRNFIVHDYLGENINFQIIKNVVENELPALKTLIEEILIQYP